MKVFRVAVTGGRDHVITHEEDKRFRALLQEKWLSGGVIHLVVLHGNARGVDQEAARIAELCGFPAVPFEAPWDTLGRVHRAVAGPLRNWMMLKAADLLVAFEGGRGTANCVKQAGELGVEVVRL